MHRSCFPRALRVLLSAAVSLCVCACTTVPGTNRSQLSLVPLSTEMSLGEQGYAETLGTAKVLSTGPQAEIVARVGQRISAAAERLYPDPSSQFDWKIRLIDEPETVNAWCMPGGKMAVFTGLLPITQDENSLAIVVGHEVAHAVARHGGERMSQGLLLELGFTATNAALGDMSPAEKDQIMQALTGTAELGIVLPFSRSHESEADQLGLYLAADAGYDPQAAIGLWERMAASSNGQKPSEFFSTHPSDATRIANLKQLMPEAMQYYKDAQKAGR